MGLPYLRFYPTDFFGDPKVMRLSGEEMGFYAVLLLAMWDTKLPADPQYLAKTFRYSEKKIKKYLKNILNSGQPLFTISPEGYLENKRLEEERTHGDDVYKKRISASLAGVAARKKKGEEHDHMVQPYGHHMDNHMVNQPEPEPEPKPKEALKNIRAQARVETEKKLPVMKELSPEIKAKMDKLRKEVGIIEREKNAANIKRASVPA